MDIRVVCIITGVMIGFFYRGLTHCCNRWYRKNKRNIKKAIGYFKYLQRKDKANG